MLLIRELRRVLGDVLSYSFTSGRIILLIALIGALLIIAVTTSVTVVGPVALYPFL